MTKRTSARESTEAQSSNTASPAPETPPSPSTKIDALVALLRRPSGAKINELMSAVGWQAHSVRGALAGTIKKKLGLTLVSEKIDGQRVYRIPPVDAA